MDVTLIKSWLGQRSTGFRLTRRDALQCDATAADTTSLIYPCPHDRIFPLFGQSVLPWMWHAFCYTQLLICSGMAHFSKHHCAVLALVLLNRVWVHHKFSLKGWCFHEYLWWVVFCPVSNCIRILILVGFEMPLWNESMNSKKFKWNEQRQKK